MEGPDRRIYRIAREPRGLALRRKIYPCPFAGIDMDSTTTKVVIAGEKGDILSFEASTLSF
jgi:activator of 2-hydroxyglutaryl-CoA dehydratase